MKTSLGKQVENIIHNSVCIMVSDSIQCIPYFVQPMYREDKYGSLLVGMLLLIKVVLFGVTFSRNHPPPQRTVKKSLPQLFPPLI